MKRGREREREGGRQMLSRAGGRGATGRGSGGEESADPNMWMADSVAQL